ncbi:MAG: DUF2442 domain-containing protein [Candidatus Goldbacteria bacterium]|nr:DUF2442 domain-containing protein [Candidatus Goldiibacteriota bacterium]
MHKITRISPIKGYKIKVKISDGAEGKIDLSDLKGKCVFSSWNDEKTFNAVFIIFINKENNTVTWPGGIDLCPDVLYAKVTGKSLDSVLKSGAGV